MTPQAMRIIASHPSNSEDQSITGSFRNVGPQVFVSYCFRDKETASRDRGAKTKGKVERPSATSGKTSSSAGAFATLKWPRQTGSISDCPANSFARVRKAAGERNA